MWCGVYCKDPVPWYCVSSLGDPVLWCGVSSLGDPVPLFGVVSTVKILCHGVVSLV